MGYYNFKAMMSSVEQMVTLYATKPVWFSFPKISATNMEFDDWLFLCDEALQTALL